MTVDPVAMFTSNPDNRRMLPRNTLRWLLPALAMSVGWGVRGDYGHETGAMIPGALVALAICLTSGRADWWNRASLLAMLGGMGWAFGGQMSYGRIVGYTAHSSVRDVTYGYASLFVIGALWGGIGAGVLALGITRPRSELERFAWPLILVYTVWQALDLSGWTVTLHQRYDLYDSDWIAATSALLVALCGMLVPGWRRACLFLAVLAAGWWAGLGGLVCLCGLRMTPPRGDNWAGCVGIQVALLAWFYFTRNRAALRLTSYGLLAGGLGFAIGDFLNVLGRAQWGPIGAWDALRNLGYWKWMEQGFGLIMGLGVELGFSRMVRDEIPSPVEDEPPGLLHYVALVFLLLVMQWHTLWKNVRTWSRNGLLRDGLFDLEPRVWFLIVGMLLSLAVLVAIFQHCRGRLALVPTSAMGRAQLLFLLILWVAVIGALLQALPGLGRKGTLFVHTTFWLTATACTLIVVSLSEQSSTHSQASDRPLSPLGWRHALLWMCVPVVLAMLSYASCATHAEPLPGSHRRFEAASESDP